MNSEYFKGKGAQINVNNRFERLSVVQDHVEGLDEPLMPDRPQTELYEETPRKIISKNDSPDLPFIHSINPYQGCEHGCVYCYARNSHEYWGFSAGLDFESKIIVKKQAAELLEKQFLSPSWKPSNIMLSGNTDCYQPLESKLKITRSLLEVFLKYRNPVGIITKNALICRDLDLLSELAKYNLVHVYFSITTFDESLRRLMEPRTSSAKKKIESIRILTEAGVPVGIMNAPIIPGLNHHEIPAILKAVGESGARTAGYTVVRLNGQIAQIFKDWLEKNFPDRASKVWNQISTMHGGEVNDSAWGRRMTGEGNHAAIIHQLFASSRKKYLGQRQMPAYNLEAFRKGGNYSLF